MPSTGFKETLPKGVSFEMIHVEGGTLIMGSDASEAFPWEQPVHEVILGSFYIGKFSVTQGLWKSVMSVEYTPSHFSGDSRPVERISWYDTQVFLRRLNELTGKPYRLPTEAEWEYAVRGGRQNCGYAFAGGNKLKEVGWYRSNSHGETKAVGLNQPNQLGLYDMSGNVWEWIEDQWHENYEDAPKDGSAWRDRKEPFFQVIRGGSWSIDPEYCRCSSRDYYAPDYKNGDVGFRLAMRI